MMMVRNLLADRFTAKVHHELREFPTYDLVVAKGGPKLTPARETSQTAPPPDSPESGETKLDADGFPHLNRPGTLIYNFSPAGTRLSRMVANAQTMSQIAMMLGDPARAKVADKTGLEGKYDFKLEFAFESGPIAASPGDPAAASPPVPSIFSAIKKLGL